MNDELEDKDLAELLKQIPAPDRLDADRRAAILAALPKDEAHVGRPRRSRSTMLAHLVSLAATITLMVLFGGLLIPNFLTTRSMKCAIDPVACEIALPESSVQIASGILDEEVTGNIPLQFGNSDARFRDALLKNETDGTVQNYTLSAASSDKGADPFSDGPFDLAETTDGDKDADGKGWKQTFGSLGVEWPTDSEGRALTLGADAPKTTSSPAKPQGGEVSSRGREVNSRRASAVAPDQEADGDGLVGIATKNTKKNEAGFAEKEAAKVLEEPALVPELSTLGAFSADGPEGPAKRKESGRSDEWGVAAPAAESTPSGSSDLYASRLDVQASSAPAEAQKPASGTGGALGLGIDTTSSSSGLDVPQAVVAASPEVAQVPAAAPPMSPKPAYMHSVAITKSPIAMRGVMDSRSSGQRGRDLQSRGGVAELRSYNGVVAAAEQKADETLNRASAELSEKIVAAERLAEPQKADVAYKLGDEQMPARALREASDLPAGRYNRILGRAPFGPKPELEQAEQMLQAQSEELKVEAVLQYNDVGGRVAEQKAEDGQELAVLDRMKSIEIPDIDFREAKLADVVQFLGEASREFDSYDIPADQRGVKVVLNVDATQLAKAEAAKEAKKTSSSAKATGETSDESTQPLTMSANYTDLKSALDVVTELADLEYSIKDNVVVISSRTAPKEELAVEAAQEALEESTVSMSERRWTQPPKNKKAFDADIRMRLEKAKDYYATDELGKSREVTEKILCDYPWSEDAVNMLRKVGIAENKDVSNERVIAREQMIKDVSVAWSPSTYGTDESVGGVIGAGSEVTNVADAPGLTGNEMAVVERMKQIMIPEMDFRQASITDITAFFADISGKNGILDASGENANIDFVLHGVVPASDNEDGNPGAFEKTDFTTKVPPITMNARQISLLDAVDQIADISNLRFLVRGNEVGFFPRANLCSSLVHRMFNVLPATAQRFSETPQEHVQGEDENAVDSEALKMFFGELGVQWPKGSQCRYMPQIGKLVVSNTPDSLVELQKVLDKLHEEDATPEPPPLTFAPFTLIPTAEHPLSTFGLDTDMAGYKRSAALISRGLRPRADMIRQEEFINAFEYGDTAPNEATFRIYLEGAQSPFRSGNNLLRVGVKGRRLGREEQRPLTLTILLDASGSMETPERMALARTAILALLKNLSPDDTVTLLTCADRTRESFRMTGWGDEQILETAKQALNAIRCQGATDLENGIVNAYANASASFNPHGENRVVIISDGIANLGNVNPENILAKVASYRDRGIRCSVIGVGHSTYNDTFLEAMANRGDGQYNFLDSEKSIDENFVNDLENSFNTIASDVKIQVEWDMKAVRAYRSHGYDSRALKDEQFRDDTVDAGEVGSGQGVAVVYEMQLEESAKPTAVLGTVRIRYRRVDTGAVEEIEEPITAEMVMRDFGGTRPQFRLACAVAEFATVLKHMPAEAQGAALRDVSSIADGAAMELDFYTPAKEFAETVKKLMGIGL